VDVSVILCTYNRATLLERSLECLRRQVASAKFQWELIVIDNNCTDSTAEVLHRANLYFPVPLRVFHEIKQGLSHARNRGIKEAQGTYLIFTDDDVEPDAHWVENMWSTFVECDCEAVAGRVELQWRCRRPEWVADELLGFLAHVDYGDKRIPLESDEKPPIGANMGFKAAVFSQIGDFDPALGRNADKLIGGEEIDLFNRFRNHGFTAIYQPDSIVYHSIDRDRIRKSYFRSLHFNSGKISGTRYQPKGKHLMGVPLFIMPQTLRSVFAFAITVIRQGFHRSLRKEMTVWYFLGFILGCNERYRSNHRALS